MVEALLGVLEVVPEDGQHCLPHHLGVAVREVCNLARLHQVLVETHLRQYPELDDEQRHSVKAAHPVLELLLQVHVEQFAQHPYHHGHRVQPLEQIPKEGKHQVLEEGDIWPRMLAFAPIQHEDLPLLVDELLLGQLHLRARVARAEHRETDVLVDP